MHAKYITCRSNLLGGLNYSQPMDYTSDVMHDIGYDTQVHIGGVFLLRQIDLTDLARCVCRSFIRPSISFLVF